jgi:hypothetical protein
MVSSTKKRRKEKSYYSMAERHLNAQKAAQNAIDKSTIPSQDKGDVVRRIWEDE